MPINQALAIVDTIAPAEEDTESWGGHSEKLKIFLLQKLNSYGEP